MLGEGAIMTTTKKDLASRAREATGCKWDLAAEVVASLFAAMTESLIEGNRIEIRGFGVLEVRDTKAKPKARNPRTGEIVYIPARRKTHFRAGKLLREELHKPLEET